MEYYMKGKIFCGNRHCEKECYRKSIHVPYRVPFLQETFKPDKDNNCKHQEEFKTPVKSTK